MVIRKKITSIILIILSSDLLLSCSRVPDIPSCSNQEITALAEKVTTESIRLYAEEYGKKTLKTDETWASIKTIWEAYLPGGELNTEFVGAAKLAGNEDLAKSFQGVKLVSNANLIKAHLSDAAISANNTELNIATCIANVTVSGDLIISVDATELRKNITNNESPKVLVQNVSPSPTLDADKAELAKMEGIDTTNSRPQPELIENKDLKQKDISANKVIDTLQQLSLSTASTVAHNRNFYIDDKKEAFSEKVTLPTKTTAISYTAQYNEDKSKVVVRLLPNQYFK